MSAKTLHVWLMQAKAPHSEAHACKSATQWGWCQRKRLTVGLMQAKTPHSGANAGESASQCG